MDPADDELIERIAHGNPEAVRELYRRHGRMVYGIALSICGADAAEEVTQDVFLKIWNRADTYSASRARPVTWIARIARNRSIDALRAAGAREGREDSEDAGGEQFLDPRGVDPADSLVDGQRRERVRAAVAALPAAQRRVLWLAFFRGLSHSQVAKRLGEPLGTVKTRIRDSLAALRRQLGEDGR